VLEVTRDVGQHCESVASLNEVLNVRQRLVAEVLNFLKWEVIRSAIINIAILYMVAEVNP